VHGLYGSRGVDDPQGAVYVGAGVGAAVVPLRLGERAKREVAFFELGEQPGAFDEHHREQPAHPGRKPSHKTKERRAQAVLRKAQKRQRRNGNGSDRGAGLDS
jgi:choline dehydrogenase-like flavoprotein